MSDTEKAAARKWKIAHPSRTLKSQRRALDLGKITMLPWLATQYYTNKE
jgi:hypothetical protein|tara:strand:+ start:1987 stop:2133 length:147 start_codon:yes stop_codon:yes gene_type:complete